MVSQSPDDPTPFSAPKLQDPPPRDYEVIVPVMLRVRVFADDELQAEVRAVEVVRRMQMHTSPQSNASVRLASVISPMTDKSFKSQPA